MTATVSTRNPLPRWAETLRQKYLAGEASTFVLYRNVFDNFLVADTLHNLQSFLLAELFKETKKQVVEISLERGIRVLSGKPGNALVAAGDDENATLLRSLHALESVLNNQFFENQQVSIQGVFILAILFIFDCITGTTSHHFSTVEAQGRVALT